MMPTYEFVNQESGSKVESFFSYDDAPRIGDVIVIDGQECRRVASFILDESGIARKTHKYPYVSRTLPRNINGCDCNNTGQPIIKSQAHERNVASEHEMAKE